MNCVIIFEKDLKNLGNKLMKDFYEQIHDDYFLEEFEEVKLKRKYYDENFTKVFTSFCKNKQNNFVTLDLNLNIKDLLKTDKLYNEDILTTIENEIKKNKDLSEDLLMKKIEAKIEDESLDVELIFKFFDKMEKDLKINPDDEFEIYEDFFCRKKGFLYIYEVFYNCHKELEFAKKD